MENRFFSGVARIQTDREHVVCDSGPYRIVRHPGYVGNILPLLGIMLTLSSLWTIIPILLGGGRPLLPTSALPHMLTLTAQRVFPSGIVWLEYTIHQPGAVRDHR